MLSNAFQLNTLTHGTCFYLKCLIGREPRSDHSKPLQSPSTKCPEVPLGVGYLRSKQSLRVHLSLVSRCGKKYSKGIPSASLSLWPDLHIWFNAQPHRVAKSFLLSLSVPEAPTPLLVSMGTCTPMVHRHTCKQINHTCKINIHNF